MTTSTLAVAADTERDVLTLLASGRLRDVRRRAAAGPPGLVADVAAADSRARSLAADLPELQSLLERVMVVDGPAGRLRFWADAMVAERLLLDADPDALAIAEQSLAVLDALSLPTLPPLALRYARARLRRVRSAGWLLVAGIGGWLGYLLLSRLVLLLVLAFSTSGLVQVLMGDHAASAASLSHEIASVSPDADNEPCCPEHDGQPHGTTCSMASGCSFCVPLLPALALMAPLDTETLEVRSEDVRLGRAPSPGWRATRRPGRCRSCSG